MGKTPHMFDIIKKKSKQKTTQNKKKSSWGVGRSSGFAMKGLWAFQKTVMLLCSFSTALAVERPEYIPYLSANAHLCNQLHNPWSQSEFVLLGWDPASTFW